MTTTLRRLTNAPSRLALGAYVPARTAAWPEASRLFVVGDGRGWSIDDDRARLTATAHRLGCEVAPTAWARHARRQSVFSHDHFGALQPRWLESSHRLGLSYFHGRPGTPGMPEFDACFSTLRRRHGDIDRVQVTNAAMEGLVLETGLAPEKVHRIPIGVDAEAFAMRTPGRAEAARRVLDVPSSAFVVGSFQKDGVGWGDGLEPKLIKGPDVLLAVVERLRERVPELLVLLTGPARGYVRAGLERLGVPHRHVLLPGVDAVAQAYDAIDLCLVTSRDEGGPRAVLESMATGVPLVSTRVGQGADLVRHGENGWLAAVEGVEELVHWSAHVAGAAESDLSRVRAAARETAEANSYPALVPRWEELLRGFVDLPQRA